MLMMTYSPAGGGGGGGSDFPVYLSVPGLSGSLNRLGTVVTSSAVTATWTGSVGNITFEWEFVTGDLDVYPTAGGLTTTRFAAELTLIPSGVSATYRAKVTDSLGNVGYSANLPITLFNYLS